MAEQRPLVLINGDMQELPLGDTVAGGGAASELDVPYNEEIDFVGDTVIYQGWADPGTATSASTWRIRKTEFIGVDEDPSKIWADGNGNFDNVWDDRASLSYS